MAEEAKQASDKTEVKQPKVETVGEVIHNDKPKDESKPKDDRSVPEAVFLEIKNDNKELRRDLKDLKKLIEHGATKGEVTDEIAQIAKEYDIQPDFLKKLASSIRKDVEKESEGKIDAKVSDILKPIEAKDRAKEIDRVFGEHFDAALKDMPEYDGIVNRAVIKSLSLDPSNKDKTFPQLIEETYGNALGGKRTLETTKPRGGRAPEGVDIDRARKDSKYFAEVMADPDLKKQYNEGLVDRIKDHL